MDAALPTGWKHIERPPSLFKRFEFGSYAETRAFLDALAALSERTGLYPDLGFGTRYVNVTVHGATGGPPTEAQVAFVREVEGLPSAHP
ncbi:MAG: 4a-hydroxytetrahydrobiopterin dehydratase [Burkholderiales bacterium]|nr:4a-hydroxytetrahydrobiopterin dehydratase [Burkholderiales bacterium]